MLSRRNLLAVLAALPVVAAAGPSRAAAVADPRAFIQNLADTAMNTVAVGGLSDAERAERIRGLFVKTFDLNEIGKFVLGRYWRAATPAQQQEFLRLFEDIQVYTWTLRFRDYSGETLEIVGVTPDGERGTLVESRIQRNRQPPIAVQWRLRQQEDGPKVVDIVVEGVSMAITHRSDYTSALQGQGGRVDGLLDIMRRKVTQLQGETSARAH